MKKAVLFVTILCCLSAAGCGLQGENQTEEYAVWSNAGGGCITDDGYYFTRDSENGSDGILLYYFDRASGVTVPVCDKAECSHQAVDPASGESAVCNAQISTYTDFLVYKDKIYYMDHEERKLCLRSRDTDGNHDEKVAVLDASELGGRMWFYRDHAFIMAATDVSQSFDPETRASEESRLRLFAVNLNSGKSEILAESSLTAAVNYAFSVYQMEDGMVGYYDLERDEWYVYDTEKESCEVQEEEKPQSRVGTAGEYTDIYGRFCYDIFEDDAGKDTIMRLDRSSGEETVLYSGQAGNDVGYVIWGMDCMYITEQNRQDYSTESICYYDMEKEKLQPLSESLSHDSGTWQPVMGDEKGLVYSVAVGRKEGQVLYTGDFEYRYITLEDAIAGDDSYQVIYYLEQEGE